MVIDLNGPIDVILGLYWDNGKGGVSDEGL